MATELNWWGGFRGLSKHTGRSLSELIENYLETLSGSTSWLIWMPIVQWKSGGG